MSELTNFLIFNGRDWKLVERGSMIQKIKLRIRPSIPIPKIAVRQLKRGDANP